MRTHTQLKSLFAAALIPLATLTTLTALAQVTGAGQSKRLSVVGMPPGTRDAAQLRRLPLQGASNADRFAANGSQIRQRGARAAEPGSSVSFLPPVTYSSYGLLATSVAVADLNGDRKPDVVVANCAAFGSQDCSGGGSLAVFLGNGDGTFQPATTYDSGGGNTFSVAVADVDGDGKPDLVVVNLGSSTVSVLLGNGDGTFQSAIIYDSGGLYPTSVAVADVNGDGKLDLVVSNDCDISCSLGEG